MLINCRLGTFFNCTPGNAKKQKVKQWAWEAYPKAYEDLVKCGMYKVTKGNPDEDEDEDEWEERKKYIEEEVYFNIGPLGRDPQP